MILNMTSPKPEGPSDTSQEPARKSVVFLTAMIGFGAIVLVVAGSKYWRSDSKANPSEAAPIEEPAPGRSRTSRASEPGSPLASLVRDQPQPAGTVSDPDPVQYASQLVASLSEVNLQPGGITPETAAKWHRQLEELIEQSSAALPALEEFFQKNHDVRFDSSPGTNLLEEPSLRIALIKVLFDLPAPENVKLQEQLLRTTTDQDEIVLLASQLEQQEPGPYREVILEATRTVLEKMKTGLLPDRDPTPLLKILEQYGPPDVK